MEIPQSFMTKFSPYEVEIQGKKITTYVVYNYDEINRCLILMTDLIEKKKHRRVGIDVKKDWKYSAKLLILCISSHCLVIQLDYVDYLPRLLKDVMSYTSICFVGDKNGIGTCFSRTDTTPFKVNGVELGFLAARMKKNPDLLQERGGLRKLADAAGVEMPYTKDIKTPNWGASVFSDEQMKIVIHDAYMRFLIAAKLLGVHGDC